MDRIKMYRGFANLARQTGEIFDIIADAVEEKDGAYKYFDAVIESKASYRVYFINYSLHTIMIVRDGYFMRHMIPDIAADIEAEYFNFTVHQEWAFLDSDFFKLCEKDYHCER